MTLLHGRTLLPYSRGDQLPLLCLRVAALALTSSLFAVEAALPQMQPTLSEPHAGLQKLALQELAPESQSSDIQDPASRPADSSSSSASGGAGAVQASSLAPVSAFPDDPFAPGPFTAASFSLPASSKSSPEGPPRPLSVFAPAVPAGGDASSQTVPATAPVVVFVHGFNLKPQFYSQLFAHLATHGILVIAPLMYDFCNDPDASGEIQCAASTISWLKSNFSNHHSVESPILPADFNRLCIAGHSRGGKVAFGVALRLGIEDVGVKAVFVLDPVDGMSNTTQTPPPILKHQPSSLHLGAPVLVVGTGLGPCGKWRIFPACAPQRMGHSFFYSDSAAPAYHVRGKDFGHMDMLDDVTDGAMGKLTYVACKNGPARKPMRTFCAGISVAFMKGVFEGQHDAFVNLLKQPAGFPIDVDEIFVRDGVNVLE